MQRFYITQDMINGENITVFGDDANHILKVLRYKEGDTLLFCDGEATDYFCTIVSTSKGEVVAKIDKTEKNNTEPPISITLYQSIPKGDKMEYIIQKCVELGVANIVPVESKRCVAKLKDDKKLLRWQKIADEAAKQCGRGKLVKVCEPVSFKDAVKLPNDNTHKIIPYENEKDGKLKEVLKNNKTNEISVYIGPEGGFSDEEIDIALKNNVHSVTLGPRILRTETAPLAVISAIMYELGDW
ncbi:MAG: 16S rRNA (uracil(1498)-N(3))-methyltransferase [Ruminococcaceae bacterium]|nr:16S rRNA (uracil(1498)-N(3))-methyltransferase [Oscillospiraceae bacterium]